MNNLLVARGVTALSVPALMLALSSAPAFAGEDSDKGKKAEKVSVTVCKEVAEKDHKNKGGKDDKQKFGFVVETDKAKKTFNLKDGQCKYLDIKYKDAKIQVSEDKVHGYKVKDIYVWGDVKKTTKDDDSVKIKFKDKDEPELHVKFVNEKKYGK